MRPTSAARPRHEALDRLRGLALVAMVVHHVMASVPIRSASEPRRMG